MFNNTVSNPEMFVTDDFIDLPAELFENILWQKSLH